ncbi:hypothetical protein CEXT_202921 [Caerostris extrusa]|uniref:Uncharacterized protein n=1 Tax=Caerostris extrusa TaxID=172846 RepID=A0AAV4VEY6_CAEEX|nr:hypothetical protein CEXT_202921 [Caerostris extrusa]
MTSKQGQRDVRGKASCKNIPHLLCGGHMELKLVSLRCLGHPYKSIMRYSDSKKSSIDGRHVPILSDVATRADPHVARQRSRYSLLAPPLPDSILF